MDNDLLHPTPPQAASENGAPSAVTGSPPAGCGDADQGVDKIIEEAINAVQAGWSPRQLEQHLRNLCRALMEARASAVVCSVYREKIDARLKQLKLGSMGKREWITLLKDAAAAYAVAHPQAGDKAETSVPLKPVRDVFPDDAVVPPNLVVPAGWKLTPHAVFKATGDGDVEIMPTPLLIIERLVNDAERTEAVKLAWSRDGGWKEGVFPREVVANRRDVTGLARFGVPVTSGSAEQVVEYIARFESDNIEKLPRTQVRRQLGWVDGGLSGFLWGHRLLRADTRLDGDGADDPPGSGTRPVVSPGPSLIAGPAALLDAGDEAGSGRPENTVSFQGADVGDEQVAAAYHARGSFTIWKSTIQPALEHARVRLVVVEGLSPPVLSILKDEGAKNHSVDLCGPTSLGKTTTLRIAASVWGNPDEKSPSGGAISTWNATRVGAERGAGLVNGLPIIRDDTKLARKREDVAQVLYDVAAGRTRDRGSPKGLDRTSGFTTVLLLSGESRAVSFSGDGGTRGRVLTLWGSPFQRSDADTAALVNRLNTALLQHYGHAGPHFVRYLLRHREDWPSWRERYRRIKEEYLAKADGNTVVGRLGDALAVITLTSELAADALDMPAFAPSPVDYLWEVLTAEAAEADRAVQALLHLLDWAVGHQDQFCSRRADQKQRPNQGWVGVWDRDGGGRGPWRFLGLLQNRLVRILAEAGYDYDSVVSTWKDRGWLIVDKSDKAQRFHQVVVDGERARVIAVTREAIDDVCYPASTGELDLHEQVDVCRYFINTVQQAEPQADAAVRGLAIAAATRLLQSLLTRKSSEAIPGAPASVPPVATQGNTAQMPAAV